MSMKGLMTMLPERVTPTTTVEAACKIFHDAKLGAVAVVEDGKVCGIFTYRDLVERVVLGKKDPAATELREVMTDKVDCVGSNSSYGVALRMMVENDYTYVPVVRDNGVFAGMLSLRVLLEHRIDHLANELDTVTQYVAVDGPGGD